MEPIISANGVLCLSTSFISRFNLRRRFASGAVSIDGASAGDGTARGLRSRGPMSRKPPLVTARHCEIRC
jgi:hypothetical protein